MVGIVVIATGWQSTNAFAQFPVRRLGLGSETGQESIAGVYLPTDRALSRAVARARERLANGEYHEVLAFLHGILAREEDSFLEQLDGEHEQLGLKATARRLIGELPREGREAYELLYGAAARRELEAALDAGDQNAIAQVVRQYFHTSAGYEAALVLAQMEADQGHRLAAAQLYQELIETPSAAAKFGPQLLALAAINQFAAGQAESAAKILQPLAGNRPAAEVVLSGQASPVPSTTEELIEWLTRATGQPVDSSRANIDWMTQRGDPARNTRITGGPPHLRARWQARVVNDPAVETYLAGRASDFLQRGIVVTPAAQPIAVGDVVVMRTLKNVVAIDWQTGKRVWETREDDGLNINEVSDLRQRFDGQPWNDQGNPLDSRIWDDALVNSLSSDGQRVFVVRGVRAPEEDRIAGWPPAGGFGRPGGEVGVATNQLAAYDLATQGKLVWELDGSRTAQFLDGAFFLGAPLAIDDTLYAIAEIRSAVYLVALDPATGKVRWQQQLVGLEQGISLDPVRRRCAASPSYDGGILVCPTGASAVVGIDVVKREFAWVYRYPRQPQSPTEARNLWQQAGQPQLARANDRWLDNSAVIAEGHVFLTPSESAELHCLDLRTGKLLWKQRQANGLFIGGIDRGKVLLIGAEKVQALRVSDGMPAWEKELADLPPGALPAGHGYMSEGKYYLPLTSREIAAIDVANGDVEILSTVNSEAPLGNLICYRGSILSQSPLLLDKFEQLDALKQRAEAVLANNPNDATALRELAELRRADGDRSQAIELLKRAYTIAANDPLTQEMLAELLLEALSTDYIAHRDDVSLVSQLVREPEQQIELLRIEAKGLQKLGEHLASWDTYMRLADFTAEEPVRLRIDGHHQVRSDRWIAGRLAALWSKASPDERRQIESQIAARRPAVDSPRTASELRHYLDHLGELPGAEEVRRSLLRYLVERSRALEAEVEWLRLNQGPDQDVIEDTAELISQLKLDPTAPSGGNLSQQRWPGGRVTPELLPMSSQPTDGSRRAQAERQGGYRLLRIEQGVGPNPYPVQWFVALDCSALIGRNALGDDVFHIPVDQNNLARQYRDSSLVHAARLGHLLYVAIGGQVMAIDARHRAGGGQGELLWQTDPLERYFVDAMNAGRVPAAMTARVTRRPVYHAWSDRKRVAGAIGAGICSLGPVTPNGVVFQEQNELKCVDPISGELIWSRNDVPAGCELFGDGELVFAADVNTRVAHVYRMIDGRSAGKRELPQHEWLITSGRNVAELGFHIHRSGRVLSLRIRDIGSQEVLFDAELPVASKLTVVEPDAIAVFEPAGMFRLISVRTGKVEIQRSLQPADDLHSIQAMRTANELVLIVSRQPHQQFKPVAQFDFPLVNGLVYAFDTASGELLWPGPALVRNRGIVLSQPQDIPLLVFGDRQMVRDSSTGGGAQIRVLCIDKRTGQTVYRNDQLPDTSATRFRVRSEQQAEPIVALEMSAAKIQLKFTDAPRPPQPPANDDLETTTIAENGGLRAIGRRMSGALRSVLENQNIRRTPAAGDAPPIQPNDADVIDDD